MAAILAEACRPGRGSSSPTQRQPRLPPRQPGLSLGKSKDTGRAATYARAMPSTNLQLVFRVHEARLDPDAVTTATGITPSRSFRVGERPGYPANSVAGWEWRSALGDLVESSEELFLPEEAIAFLAAAGASYDTHIDVERQAPERTP